MAALKMCFYYGSFYAWVMRLYSVQKRNILQGSSTWNSAALDTENLTLPCDLPDHPRTLEEGDIAAARDTNVTGLYIPVTIWNFLTVLVTTLVDT